MAIPILSRRKDRRQAQIDAAVEAGVEKAISPMLAMAAQQQASSGATYALNPSSPFGQAMGTEGYVPLPRPEGLFDSGFGPGFPLIPSAIDPLGENGRTIPRRSQYLISANVNLIDRRLPWSVLKGLAEDVDVIQRCIQIVQDALVGLDWSWGFSPQIIAQIMNEQDLTNSAKATAIAREKYGDELDRVQTFFQYPDKKMGFTFDTWLTDIIASHLTFDGVVIAPSYNLGGELTSLSTIDTSTIKILLDNQGFIPRPPAPAYQQILYGFPRGEYQAENLDSDGKVPNGYTDDQISYYIRRPHASNLYGYSQVEECINIATIYMERQAWLHAEYSHGVTPKMYVETAGTETWTPEALAYYEKILNDQWSGQTQRRQQIMLGRPGMKPTQLKSADEAYGSAYDEYLILQMGAKFGIPQSMLGVAMKSSIGGGAAGKQQSDQSEQFATDALKNWLIGIINDMSRRYLGVGPELTMTATGGGNDDDDLTRAQADEIDVNTGIRTRNEIRAERGIPLMNEPEADQLGVTIATGVSFLSGALEAQQTAAALAAQPPTPPQTHTVTTAPDGTVTETHGAPTTPATAAHGGSASVGGTAASVTNTSASVAPKAKTADNEAPAGVAPKDDSRQPDAENETAKELAAFAKFAKARCGKTYRDFEFTHVAAETAERLNNAGRIGDLTAIKDIANAAKSTTVTRVIDPYAHIPEADKAFTGRDAYPDTVIERITLDYTGQPRAVETVATVAGDAPVVTSKAVEPFVGGMTANDAILNVADIVAGRVSGDIARLRETFGLLAEAREMTKAKAPIIQIDNHIPEQPAPVVHIDNTQHHDHHVQVDAPIDATSTHNVTVEKSDPDIVNVAAPDVTINVPKQPKPQVTVVTGDAKPTRSDIVRGEDGNISIVKRPIE